MNSPHEKVVTEPPLFEVFDRNGHTWKLYEDGTITGFPDGVVVINRALPLLDSFRVQQTVMNEQKRLEAIIKSVQKVRDGAVCTDIKLIDGAVVYAKERGLEQVKVCDEILTMLNDRVDALEASHTEILP